MNVVLASAVVVVFAVTIERLHLASRAREVGRRTAECLAVLRDPSLSDDVKEKALQRHSLRLFGLLGILAGGSLLALGLPLGGVWLLDRVALASGSGVLAMLQRIDFPVASTAVGIGAYLSVRRLGRT